MEVYVFVPSPSHFLPVRTLISSILVRRCPAIVAQQAICYGRRRRKTKRPPSLSPVLKRLVGQTFSMVLSNPRLLPPPLDLIATEFMGGGDDGNGRLGSGWRWSDGWGSRGLRRGLGFWLVAILIGLSLLIVKELEINPKLGILVGLGLGIGMMGFIEKLTGDYWVLGFCCFGVLLGLGLNKELRSSAGKFLSSANKWRGRRRRDWRRFLGFR